MSEAIDRVRQLSTEGVATRSRKGPEVKETWVARWDVPEVLGVLLSLRTSDRITAALR
jgi:hypothetical protein